MKLKRTPILALFATAACIPAAHAGGDIVVAAQETAAAVAPRPASLRLVNLPSLEFALRAAIQCKGETVSVTFSIADTFRTLGQDDLAGPRSAEVSLTVPPSQLALAASSNFCVEDDGETTNELLVPGLATVHASLRCANETGPSVHYASAPLKVRLKCAREPDENQEPSADK